ncbi:MAG: hypothetical protein KDD25_03560 [Bdellovibrionales bacterium]|nr:hypothetical protein [Bdellovibrionales bacterium]
MQVKKFEAPTMKEALELVKVHLGPEAIILSAQENKGFGLVGKGSVMVTAAISSSQLKKKEFAEKHLRPNDKDRLKKASASTQRAFIEKSVNRFSPEALAQNLKQMRYADIVDEESYGTVTVKETPTPVPVQKPYTPEAGRRRVQDAVKSALSAASKTDVFNSKPKAAPKPAAAPIAIKQDNAQVESLKAEIQALKELIKDISSNRPNSASPVSLHPGAERGIPFELSATYEALVQKGIESNYAVEILKLAKSELGEGKIGKRPLVQAWVAKYLLRELKIVDVEALEKFQVFVGPTGQGRSATLIKIASDLVMKGRKRVALISCDGNRGFGSESLKIFSKILNCSFYSITKPEDWLSIMKVQDQFDHVLVEMPGTSLKDQKDMESLKSLYPPIRGSMRTHYVQSITWKDADVRETLKSYIPIALSDIIYTRVDEATNHGLIYNIQRQFGLPTFAFGMGSKIPEDIEYATKERTLDLILKIRNGMPVEGGR